MWETFSVIISTHIKVIREISESSIISGVCLLCIYSSIGYLGEDSLITPYRCWTVTLDAWVQYHLYYWTVTQKDKSETMYL